MIGKGAQYLTAAGFGRYRITAASLGSNLVFGALWLKDATLQAIMAAFGVDGTAVIRATNEYLNGIAASDKAKATALAALINEDPMMVCSLGLEPTLTTLPKMPDRFVIGDGTAWFSTGIIPQGYDHEFYTRFRLLAANQGNKGVWGKGSYTNQIANAIYLTCWNASGGFPNLFMWGWQGQHGGWRGDTSGSKYDYLWEVKMTFSQTNVKLAIDRDGEENQRTEYTSVVNFANDNIPLYMFKGNNAGASKCAIAENYDKDKYWFLPMKRNNVIGMIDVISGTFKTNEAGSGQFTESFGYMQNGQWVTWTPPTP